MVLQLWVPVFEITHTQHRNPCLHLAGRSKLPRLDCYGRRAGSLPLSHINAETWAILDKHSACVLHRTSICTLSGLLLPTACTGQVVVCNRSLPQARHWKSLCACSLRDVQRGGTSGGLERNVSLGSWKLLRLSTGTGWRSQLSIPCSITLFDWHFNEGARGRPPARGPVHAPFISQSM